MQHLREQNQHMNDELAAAEDMSREPHLRDTRLVDLRVSHDS